MSQSSETIDMSGDDDQLRIRREPNNVGRAIRMADESAKRSDTLLAQMTRAWPIIFSVGTVIVTVVGAFFTLSAHSVRLDKLDSETSSIRSEISAVKDKVGDIGGDVKAILAEQRAERKRNP